MRTQEYWTGKRGPKTAVTAEVLYKQKKQKADQQVQIEQILEEHREW